MAACSAPAKAPTEAGVCWRMSGAADGAPSFRPLARGIANLETCAVRLEGARMLEGRPVAGAYQGRFIFAEAEELSSAASLDGPRFRVFAEADKREIQAGLQRLIERRAEEN